VEKVSCSLKFLTREDIVKLNRRHIETTGGSYFEPDNLRNPDSLEWVLDAIQYPLFGIDQYPTLTEKAAMLAWVIIKGHVFYDGCKRTGMSALQLFLKQNDYQLNVTTDEIVEVALRIAGGYTEEDYSYEEFVQWVRDKLSLIPPIK
jgi:death-on-curing protein